jgi:hypothetical protein
MGCARGWWGVWLGGGRAAAGRAEHPGYRIENKNPTQRCGEQYWAVTNHPPNQHKQLVCLPFPNEWFYDIVLPTIYILVGGFNPSEKIFNGKDFPKYEMEHQKSLKPPASIYICLYMFNGSLLYFFTIHVQIWFTTSPAQASPGLVAARPRHCRAHVKRWRDLTTKPLVAFSPWDTMGFSGKHQLEFNQPKWGS